MAKAQDSLFSTENFPNISDDQIKIFVQDRNTKPGFRERFASVVGSSTNNQRDRDNLKEYIDNLTKDGKNLANPLPDRVKRVVEYCLLHSIITEVPCSYDDLIRKLLPDQDFSRQIGCLHKAGIEEWLKSMNSPGETVSDLLKKLNDPSQNHRNFLTPPVPLPYAPNPAPRTLPIGRPMALPENLKRKESIEHWVKMFNLMHADQGLSVSVQNGRITPCYTEPFLDSPHMEEGSYCENTNGSGRYFSNQRFVNNYIANWQPQPQQLPVVSQDIYDVTEDSVTAQSTADIFMNAPNNIGIECIQLFNRLRFLQLGQVSSVMIVDNKIDITNSELVDLLFSYVKPDWKSRPITLGDIEQAVGNLSQELAGQAALSVPLMTAEDNSGVRSDGAASSDLNNVHALAVVQQQLPPGYSGEIIL